MINAHVGHASGMPLEAVTTFLQAIFPGKEGLCRPGMVWWARIADADDDLRERFG